MQFLRQQIKHQIVLGLTAIGLAVTIAPEAIASGSRGYTKDNSLSQATSQVAARFEQRELEANQVIAIAAPVGRTNGYQLLVVEQLSDQRACWREQGRNPTRVDPLLLDFDFTGICGRGTDSNGYSIRAGGQDLAVRYNLQVIERGGELVLVGVPIGGDRNLPRLDIGRTRGIAEAEFSRIYLDPGWRFTRRTYQGQTLGHFYLTHDLTLAELANQTRPASPTQEPRPTLVPDPSADRSTSLQEPDASESPNTIEFGDDPRRNVPAEDNHSSTNPLPAPNPETENSNVEETQEQPFVVPVPPRQFPNSPLPAFHDEP